MSKFAAILKAAERYLTHTVTITVTMVTILVMVCVAFSKRLERKTLTMNTTWLILQQRVRDTL